MVRQPSVLKYPGIRIKKNFKYPGPFFGHDIGVRAKNEGGKEPTEKKTNRS